MTQTPSPKNTAPPDRRQPVHAPMKPAVPRPPRAWLRENLRQSLPMFGAGRGVPRTWPVVSGFVGRCRGEAPALAPSGRAGGDPHCLRGRVDVRRRRSALRSDAARLPLHLCRAGSLGEASQCDRTPGQRAQDWRAVLGGHPFADRSSWREPPAAPPTGCRGPQPLP